MGGEDKNLGNAGQELIRKAKFRKIGLRDLRNEVSLGECRTLRKSDSRGNPQTFSDYSRDAFAGSGENE